MDKNMDNAKEIIKKILTDLTGETVSTVERKSGGVNSEVYKTTADKSEYFVKRYIEKKGDSRGKLNTEYDGLSFLWKNDVREIPEPICRSLNDNVAVYRYLHGRKINSDEITLEDANMAAAFYSKLHLLVSAEGADKQPIASEACFSLKAYFKCVEDRIKRIKNLKDVSDHVKGMQSFICSELEPFLDVIREYIVERSKGDKELERKLNDNEKTLSQSDVGFHNILKLSDGALRFIDFEYYGWDDPAKLISDFYLSPDNQVPCEYREVFFKRMSQTYGKDHVSLKRLPFVYLLLAIKWCLIMLNCYFLDADEKFCSQQLERVKLKLNDIKNEFKEKQFPLSLN